MIFSFLKNHKLFPQTGKKLSVSDYISKEVIHVKSYVNNKMNQIGYLGSLSIELGETQSKFGKNQYFSLGKGPIL